MAISGHLCPAWEHDSTEVCVKCQKQLECQASVRCVEREQELTLFTKGGRLNVNG